MLLQDAARRIEAARLLLTDEEWPTAGVAKQASARLDIVALSGWAAGDAFIEHVNERLALRGRACARLLARLASEPDRLIPIVELARTMGPRGASARTIKVYVCRLRAALVE